MVTVVAGLKEQNSNTEVTETQNSSNKLPDTWSVPLSGCHPAGHCPRKDRKLLWGRAFAITTATDCWTPKMNWINDADSTKIHARIPISISKYYLPFPPPPKGTDAADLEVQWLWTDKTAKLLISEILFTFICLSLISSYLCDPGLNWKTLKASVRDS